LHWCRYNIGHVGISLGDLGLAYQAFKVAVSVDANHGEALNNIAVLEMRRQKFEVAKACLSTACEVAPHIFEPLYNSGNVCNQRVVALCAGCVSRNWVRGNVCTNSIALCAAALMSYRMGDFQDSYTLASKALKLHSQHVDSKELQSMLQKTFLNS
jgi:tetratricopeptide repeat protein 8